MTRYRAFVSGGNSGIGLVVCRMLLEAGYEVVSVGIEAHPDSHPSLSHQLLDMTDTEAVTVFAKDHLADAGITHLVHNAGEIRHRLIEDWQPEDMTGLAQLHLTSPTILTKAALPAMQAAGFGRIVFNASRAILGVPGRTSYAATKAGITGLVRSWALEWGKHGITVNQVAPGPVLTANFSDLVDPDSPAATSLKERIPAGRLGTAEDVARAMMFFCAPENSFVTGQTLFVCGGLSVNSNGS